MLHRTTDFDRAFAMMDELRRRLDWVFEEADAPRASLRGDFDQTSRYVGGPRVYLFDTGSALVVKADVPGLTEKDVQISLNQDVLTVSGERKSDAPEGYLVHRKERGAVRFSRSFTLPSKVDPEKTTAVLKNGVLTLTLNKAAEAQPRQIAVTAR
ncbi:Hsp20/alpha crystallin family protein [Sorangium sp. So ce327]|jgi:HSP20 family protein|uniref:Heat shock protein, HSP20 family n=1 Tax=Sorangium cellulosum (strain So ce56) TaxID=448385 RepID=A9GVB5_SORC5|nr:Hsp20/alpha crystallin family protein [Sorangium cellulosum]CAN90734.1 Heat shock protein, HSP20 family [Sorangium cellulosum So ce56]